jgi:hypothetical protein
MLHDEGQPSSVLAIHFWRESLILQEAEAKLRLYGVTEAFLNLTAVLLQSGVFSPTLQVLHGLKYHSLALCLFWSSRRALGMSKKWQLCVAGLHSIHPHIHTAKPSVLAFC